MARPETHSNETILAAAADLFLRDGMQASTLEIAQRAGVSEGTLFKRFKTKVALFEAAMHVDSSYDAWRTILNDSIGKRTPAENVYDALIALSGKLEQVMPKFRILHGAGRRPPPKWGDEGSPPMRDTRALAKYLEEEITLGRLTISHPLAHAHQIVGAMIHYGAEREMSGYTPCTVETYIRQLVDIHLPPVRKVRSGKKGVLSIVLAFGMSLGFAQAADKPEELSWMQCVKEASLNNPGIEASLRGVQNSEALRKGAYSMLFPQISATTEATRSYNPEREIGGSGQEVVVGGYSFGSQSSRSNYYNSYSVGLSLQQQLFDGFRTAGNIRQTKAQARVALAQLLSEKSLVSYELKSAFAQLIYAQELLGISQSIVDRRELNFRLVELKYNIGRENKGALLLSKANLSQAKMDMEQAQRTLKVSQLQLQTVMGRSVFRSVEAKGSLVTGKIAEKPDFKAIALKTPAHFQQDATVEASKAGITIAQSDFYPQISATASYTGNDNNSFVAPESWSVGVSGSLNVFDGGATYFNVRAARATLQQEQATLKGTDADTAQTLAEDFKDFVNSVENVRVSGEFLEASSLRATIAEAQYRNGLISFQDFDTITNDYITRQNTELQSRRDAVLAEAKWEQSLGEGAIP